VVFLFLSTSSCGWIFVKGPPNYQTNTGSYIPCTDGKVLPTLDAVMAGLQVANIIYTSSMDDWEVYDNYGDTEKGAVIGMQALFGTLWGFSAWSGYGKVSDCVAARIAAATRELAREAGPDARILEWRPPMLVPTRAFIPQVPTKMPNGGR
jgi:hypothetical protein